MEIGTRNDTKVGAYTFFGASFIGFAGALGYLIYPFEVIAPFII
jgi:hypothetical protein